MSRHLLPVLLAALRRSSCPEVSPRSHGVVRPVNRSCLLFFAASRTPLNPWDTCFPLCVGLVLDGTMFSLARTLFSPGSAEDRSSLFVWFIDSMVRSDSSRACVSALWLCTLADRSRSLSGRGTPEVSRFSCMLFLSVHGFSDYAGPTARSRYRGTAVLPSSIRKESAS